jgi:hypothetical protein
LGADVIKADATGLSIRAVRRQAMLCVAEGCSCTNPAILQKVPMIPKRMMVHSAPTVFNVCIWRLINPCSIGGSTRLRSLMSTAERPPMHTHNEGGTSVRRINLSCTQHASDRCVEEHAGS